MGGDRKETWEEYAEKMTPTEATSSGEGVVITDPIVAPANPEATLTEIIPEATPTEIVPEAK